MAKRERLVNCCSIRKRRKVATIDCDSRSSRRRCTEKKEGADYSYDKRWSYSALYQ